MHKYNYTLLKILYLQTICIFNTEVECGDLLAPSNGDVLVSTPEFGSTATYSCNDGYTLEGVTTRTCLASGSWSDSAPTCEKCSYVGTAPTFEMCI